MNRKKNQGFTLIEIAIVLVIIGLLLGGILKGQELITNARARNLISQQDGTKAAFLGFQDRFRALPGDYSQATNNVNGATTNGNGNGLITPNTVSGATVDEHILAWEHLSRAGFITGSYTYAVAPESPNSAPVNPYSRYLQIVYDATYADAGTPAPRHNVKTGNLVPSDLLAEVDRKIDDGNAITGAFRFSTYGGASGAAALTGTCHTAGVWTAQNPTPDCGAASLF
jgi:prepilin-type N-terminal cleavage/methylation domain-containing protein